MAVKRIVVHCVDIEDKPGSLANTLKPLREANIQVIYTYAFIRISQGKAVMIFRFSDNDKAIDVLRANGVNLLDAKTFGILENENYS